MLNKIRQQEIFLQVMLRLSSPEAAQITNQENEGDARQGL